MGDLPDIRRAAVAHHVVSASSRSARPADAVPASPVVAEPAAPPSGPSLAHTEQVMGTAVSFALRFGVDVAEASARASLERALFLLHEADEVFSLYKPASPASRLARGEIAVKDAPPQVAEVIALCQQARELTEGFFDPWAMPGGLDMSGLVKGWAARRALRALLDGGLESGLLNAGGDIATVGEPAPGKPWRLGLRHPAAEGRLLGIVELRGAGALATSGSYERGAHILTPQGRPAVALAAASVLGPDLMLADVLATALIASGGALLPRLSRLEGYEALIVGARGALWATEGFAARFVAA